jgi:hypothetical protein
VFTSSPVEPHGPWAIDPRLAVARSGAAMVAWWKFFPPSSGSELRVRMRKPGRGFGPVALAYKTPDELSIQATSVAPDGSAAIGLDVGLNRPIEPRVVLVRPGGGVRCADRVAPDAPLVVGDVLADSHGAAAMLFERDSSRGPWITRSH